MTYAKRVNQTVNLRLLRFFDRINQIIGRLFTLALQCGEILLLQLIQIGKALDQTDVKELFKHSGTETVDIHCVT